MYLIVTMYSKISIVEFTTALDLMRIALMRVEVKYVNNNSLENGSWQQTPIAILFIRFQCVFYCYGIHKFSYTHYNHGLGSM